MKLLGIVILYYPDDTLAGNINSYIEGVAQLIVWENSPASFAVDIPVNPKIIKMGNGANAGIGKALNEAAKYAKANGFTHLLTMDQDSCFEHDHFSKYISMVEKMNEKTIFSPNYMIYGEQIHKIQDTFIDAGASIQSGSLYPIAIFDEIGFFREDLIVDGIDTDFFYRAKNNGISTKIVTPAFLVHRLGYPQKQYKFLNISIAAFHERSALRSYYFIRNHLLVRKQYSEHNPYLFYNLYKRLFLVVFFETDKQAKMKGLIMGYIHGKMGKTGMQTIFKKS
ncbi:glycosyl transferase [Bacteroidia bacterium]|nr:glycosyl transferase [Bacteroidia bacterium]GHU66833.1 glycosyl transferase [Bacteroidia bacterium]